ncbi:MAG TPA: hypothetical protein VM689_15900 [Aliidongia sp.]|nr:hypothetical protein [Aliidongia sp.]
MNIVQDNPAISIAIITMVTFNDLFLSANGLFMLVDPWAWYELVPGVTSTGFFNQHFIRDIGIIQLFLGAAFVLGMAPAGASHRAMGGGQLVARRPRRFSPVGGRGRHLLRGGHSPRFSGRHPAGDHRGGADPLGGPPLTGGRGRLRPRRASWPGLPEPDRNEWQPPIP